MKKIRIVFALLFLFSCSGQMNDHVQHESLRVTFGGDHAQIEVGGPYAGIEMHRSAPALNRVSFFYPVANSIDLSADYWKREQFRVMGLGLKVGKSPRRWIGVEPFDCQLTPYRVRFVRADSGFTLTIDYRFCKEISAFVASFEIKNTGSRSEPFELYTHLELSLRTCHSYKLKDKAWTEFDREGDAIYANFNDPETGSAQIFVANAGLEPVSFTSRADHAISPECEHNHWMLGESELPGSIIGSEELERPLAAYVYRQDLNPGQSMQVVQLIGSVRQGEGRQTVRTLLDTYQDDVRAYERIVLEKAYKNGHLKTGDPILDHSVHWSKAILAANAHYLDNAVVPMPCQAQYNFYFTHDVLLTDLAAVFFDMERVKKDLEFIISHADDRLTIPHAYYWRDDRYVTEWALNDNWNHFWFTLVSARYLRHSHDRDFLEKLYPYIQRSLKLALENKGKDDLMWAFRPDWWDIGSSYGQRSYMTILMIRSLRAFNYIASALKKDPIPIQENEALAKRMQAKLTGVLWDDDLNYLINTYEGGVKDSHHYIGSMLAAHFHLLDKHREDDLVQTASRTLLDEKLGIYNVFPMDFHTLIDFLKLNGNEAGDPYVYMNGGIWPHGNAIYALALIANGRQPDANRFIKQVMSIEGIINSPNGQPAMYEYRNGNPGDPAIYGRVDKPQFLWAGSWYLYSLYYLQGMRENVWNLSFDPWLAEGQASSSFTVLINGNPVSVNVHGCGEIVERITYDGKTMPTVVVPDGFTGKSINICMGIPKMPCVISAGSVLKSCVYETRKHVLTAELSAFPGHESQVEILSPLEIESMRINGEIREEDWYTSEQDGFYNIRVDFVHQSSDAVITVGF